MSTSGSNFKGSEHGQSKQTTPAGQGHGQATQQTTGQGAGHATTGHGQSTQQTAHRGQGQGGQGQGGQNQGGQQGQASQPMDQVKEAGMHAVEKAREAAACVGEMASHTAAAVGQMASQAACNVGHRMEDMTGSAGSGIRGLADTLEQRAPQEGIFGRASHAVAETLRDGGQYIEESKLTGMADDLASVVRRNPLPALLVGVGVGILLGRMTRT